MKHGPVDVVIVAAGEPKFDGTVLAELERLAKAGTIRLLDAMIILKTEMGARVTVDIEDLPAEARSALGHLNTGTRGLFDATDADTLFEGMVPGSAVCALAIEHAWAVGLINALEGAGTELAMNYRIPAVIVDEALAALPSAS